MVGSAVNGADVGGIGAAPGPTTSFGPDELAGEVSAGPGIVQNITINDAAGPAATAAAVQTQLDRTLVMADMAGISG